MWGELCESEGVGARAQAWGSGGRKRGAHAEDRRPEGRRAHGEHGKHVRDAGGVEAQRLVERRRALPSLPRGSKGRLAVRRREAASSSVQGRARLEIWGKQRGGSAPRTWRTW